MTRLQIEKAIAALSQLLTDTTEQLFSLEATARKCSTQGVTIKSDIQAGSIEAPTHYRIGHKLPRYSLADVEKIKDFYQSRPAGQTLKSQRRKAQGLVSRADCIREAGSYEYAMEYYVRKGKIAAPTHSHPNYQGKYYLREEAEIVIQFLTERKAKWTKSKSA